MAQCEISDLKIGLIGKNWKFILSNVENIYWMDGEGEGKRLSCAPAPLPSRMLG